MIIIGKNQNLHFIKYLFIFYIRCLSKLDTYFLVSFVNQPVIIFKVGIQNIGNKLIKLLFQSLKCLLEKKV